jgi:hypothetical protein
MESALNFINNSFSPKNPRGFSIFIFAQVGGYYGKTRSAFQTAHASRSRSHSPREPFLGVTLAEGRRLGVCSGWRAKTDLRK